MKAFVVARDRVTYARRCVDALEDADLDVIVVDHGSTWPPMIDHLGYLDGLAELYGGSPPQVVRDVNRHPRDLWRLGGPIMRAVGADEKFIVTDCDVIPDPTCPADWVARLAATLDRYPAVRKAGLGLRTDDLPEHYGHRDMVRTWEAQYQAVADGGRLNPMATDGGAVLADIDTTLAMYRRFETFTLGPAVRLRPPYVARHLPWYEDVQHLDAEQQYYRDHAEHGHWRNPGDYADTYSLGG